MRNKAINIINILFINVICLIINSLVLHVDSVDAMTVYDPTVNRTLAVNFAKDIAELGKIYNGLTSLQSKLSSDLIDPLKSIDFEQLNIKQDLQTLADILQRSTEYAYQVSSASKNTLFAGYKLPDGKTYQDQYSDIVNNLQNLLNNVLASLQTNAEHFNTENKDLQDMQIRANSAQTQMQIAQSTAQIAAEGVNQMQLLRQTVIAQTNAQTAYYAAETQKEASAKAELSNIIQAGNSDITGKLDEYPLDLPWSE